MRVLQTKHGIRLVEKYLWWPKRLDIPQGNMTRLRWLSKAKIVQVERMRITWDGFRVRWEDWCFLEDAPEFYVLEDFKSDREGYDE